VPNSRCLLSSPCPATNRRPWTRSRRACWPRGLPDPAGCDRHGQDLHGRACDREVQKPTLVLAPNKSLVRAARERVPGVLPRQRRGVLRLLLRLLPTRGLRPTTDTYIEKDSSINAEIERLQALGDRVPPFARDVLIVASVSASSASAPGGVPGSDPAVAQGRSAGHDFAIQRLVDIQYERTRSTSSAGSSGCRATRSRCSPPTTRRRFRIEMWATRSSASCGWTRSQARSWASSPR